MPPAVFETGAVATGSNGNMPSLTDVIPTNTMGDQYMSLTYTPQNAGSTLIIIVIVNYGSSVASNSVVALYQDATVNALAAVGFNNPSAAPYAVPLNHKMTAGTTSPTIFKVRIGMDRAGTVTFNGFAGSRILGGVMASSIIITEILP